MLRSIELEPVAAVNVLLYSSGEQLQIRGPIQISLPLGPNTYLRAADTVPAWAFNLKTGRNNVQSISLWQIKLLNLFEEPNIRAINLCKNLNKLFLIPTLCRGLGEPRSRGSQNSW